MDSGPIIWRNVLLKVLAFYSAYTQSANSRRTGRSVVDVFSNFFRSMATWPGPVADTVAKWPHACLSARHKATNAPTDRPPLFETSRSRSAAAPRGTRVAREERFGRQVRRRQNKCPPPHFCRRISKVFGVSRSRLGVRRAARWFRARSSHAFGLVQWFVSTTTARREPGCLGGCNSAALGGPSGDRTRNERRAQQSAGPPTPRGAMAR